MIINCRSTASITYHDSLHGLWAGRGTGTTILKANLIHKVSYMRVAVLHMIFLDLHKAYNALDRYR